MKNPTWGTEALSAPNYADSHEMTSQGVWQTIFTSTLVLRLASIPKTCIKMTTSPNFKTHPLHRLTFSTSFQSILSPTRTHKSYTYSGVGPRQTTSSNQRSKQRSLSSYYQLLLLLCPESSRFTMTFFVFGYMFDPFSNNIISAKWKL